ncbi:hypothetical protein [Pseudobacteriovorax antillogorgiicola]|uniref:Uncharacterized protein n=1 Tax=Pseudobacteriovorax antillogorgiicola TaxID=1513793 RepID=A0A1Y6BWQ0_9BACT|nr:hypothetical protein [Pseudobacteriovorax antillogorgiicola]TCS52391.1 hypothetical protein EDD56_109136 [Pseudobacteriovorax antillogorgiicola]SMF29124.1 hypothetical protein SAMN06296036_10977 [Pseudobacteriovorax antillogorgiicola]
MSHETPRPWQPLLAVLSSILLLSCSPTEESTGESSKVVDHGTSQSGYSDKTTDTEEIVSAPSVPVTGAQLTFKVGSDIEPGSVDAYAVGYVDESKVVQIDDTTYQLEGVPAGEYDVIITAKKEGETIGKSGNSGYNVGIRMTRHVNNDDSGVEEIDLPYTGSISGRLEMVGVSAFDSIEVGLPGTKLVAMTPEKNGLYTLDNVPVGEHELRISQFENPEALELVSQVQEPDTTERLALSIGAEKNMMFFSTPNRPANLSGESFGDRIVLSWASGGAGTSGYLLVRSDGELEQLPTAGQLYEGQETLGNGSILYLGSDLYYIDSTVESGSSYTYTLFAYNEKKLYSEPLSKIETAARNPDLAKYYRIYFNSTASDCGGYDTTEVQELRFYIDGQWLSNDFSEETRVKIDSQTYEGLIGANRARVSASSVYNDAYAVYFAFQSNNNAWSAASSVFRSSSPFDVKSADSIYIELEFPEGPKALMGMEILGGEPPFYSDCAPDNFYLARSQDGSSWTPVAGSNRQVSTANESYRYHFSPPTVPLTPLDYKLSVNEGAVNHQWSSSLGTEIGYLLVRSTSPKPFEPSAGVVYDVGRHGDYEIVSWGKSLSATENGLLSDGSVYYYGLFSYDAAFNYSDSVLERAVPIAKDYYRYYRFVVDSVISGEILQLEQLELQFGGVWASDYSFSSEKGSIDSRPVTVTSSSTYNNLSSYAGHFVFSDNDREFWRSGKYFESEQFSSHDGIRGGEYIELDFGLLGAAISGYRVFGNDAVNAFGFPSQGEFNAIPDKVHMERSQDGSTWDIIPGSYNDNALFVWTTQEW